MKIFEQLFPGIRGGDVNSGYVGEVLRCYNGLTTGSGPTSERALKNEDRSQQRKESAYRQLEDSSFGLLPERHCLDLKRTRLRDLPRARG